MKSINQSIETHLYSAICLERIRGAWNEWTCHTLCPENASH